MSDLISRQAAISICDNAIDLWNGQLGTGALVAVRDAIMALPSAQPKRKTGHWINSYKRQTCSICKQGGYRSWNFCPNCGADMRGEQDE